MGAQASEDGRRIRHKKAVNVTTSKALCEFKEKALKSAAERLRRETWIIPPLKGKMSVEIKLKAKISLMRQIRLCGRACDVSLSDRALEVED